MIDSYKSYNRCPVLPSPAPMYSPPAHTPNTLPPKKSRTRSSNSMCKTKILHPDMRVKVPICSDSLTSTRYRSDL